MYGEQFKKACAENEGVDAIVVPPEFGERYPAIAMALTGVPGDKKAKIDPIPPASFILFARDGGIGFIISPKDARMNAHGFIRDPDELLAQIDQAILAGNLGWKTPKRK